jgi:uncharacterized damage-inducible protein DinB
MEPIAQSIPARRAQLQARLAAERTHLLLPLEGLDEAALSHDPVIEGWTASALLAHLAYWEAFAADRLAKLADGRRAEIQPLGENDTLEARNAAMRARFALLPFVEAVAICQKERRGFLMALSRVPDAVLDHRVQFRPGWRVTPHKWARWPYRHDAEHAIDLIRWRGQFPPNDPSRRVIHRSLLRPLLGLSRQEFIALAALIPEGERETRPVGGSWTLKQVIGHLSDYERLGIVALKALAAGREPAYETAIPDFDDFNNQRGEVWAAHAWEEVWAIFTATRQALLRLTETLPNETLVLPFAAPWLEMTTACGYLLDMAQHERGHAENIRRVLGLPALPRRLGWVL